MEIKPRVARCENCGIEFEPKKTTVGRFCGRGCYLKFCRRNKGGVKAKVEDYETGYDRLPVSFGLGPRKDIKEVKVGAWEKEYNDTHPIPPAAHGSVRSLFLRPDY